MPDLVGNPEDGFLTTRLISTVDYWKLCGFCSKGFHLPLGALNIVALPGPTIITADNQLNAKPVVKQRHPGDEFPVSL